MTLRKEEDNLILKGFNTRDTEAFVVVYRHFFTDLYLYAEHLYRNTPELPDDAVQNAFCYLWEHTSERFETCLQLKTFLYTAIRNRYFNYMDHQKVHVKYETEQSRVEDGEEAEVYHNEVCAYLTESLHLLPPKHASVMRLYLDGYESEEIAQQLSMSIRTVYNLKSESVAILKKKLNKRDL